MSSAPYTLEDLEAELEEGWEIRWDGRTGADYPPNYRIVELEMDVEGEPYTRQRQLQLLEKEFEEVEKLRDDEDAEGEEAEGDEAEDGDENSEALPDPIDDLPGSIEELAKLNDDELRALADHVDADAGSDPDRGELIDELIGTLELEEE
jgi:hypothetical protein